MEIPPGLCSGVDAEPSLQAQESSFLILTEFGTSFFLVIFRFFLKVLGTRFCNFSLRLKILPGLCPGAVLNFLSG